MRIEIIGSATLYLGDCREILPTLGKVDAVVTDPPYGIGADKSQKARAGKKSPAAIAVSTDYGDTDWDSMAPEPELIKLLRHISTVQIIFGGNYFDLPPSRCWLVWDKQTGDNNYADCELAWTNMDKPVRKIEWLWKGMMRKGNDVREHPTQKPEGVMKWCIAQLPETANFILDPYMGSGTTGVAAIAMGRQFIGIEQEESYFEIALRRIAEAIKQPDIFFDKPKQSEQLTWDEMWAKPFDRPELVWGNLPAKPGTI